MTYLLSQLWFCLLLAWMLGNIVGWLLRGGCSQHIKRVEENWRSRYLELEKEKEANFRKLKKLMVVSHDRDSLSDELARFQGIENSHSKLKMRLATAEKGAKESQAVLRMRAQNIVGLQNSITTSKKIIGSKDDALKELTRKLKESINQIKAYKSKLLESNTQKDQSLKAIAMKLNKSDAINVSLNTQLKETNATMASELKKAHAEVAKKIGGKQQEVEKVVTELDQAREQMIFCRGQLEEADVQNNSLTAKLSEGNARMDILANEFAKMASQLNNAKAEVAEKRESSKKLELVGVKLKETEAKLSEALDKGSKEVKVAETTESQKELELVGEKLKDTEERLSKALAKNTKQEVEAADTTESHKELELVESKLKETEGKLSKALDKNAKHKAKINKISVKLDSSRLKLVDAHKLLQENQKSNSQNSPTDKEIVSRATRSELTLNGEPSSVQTLTSKGIDSGEWQESSSITDSQKSVIEVELKQSKHKIKKLEAETVKNQVHLQKLELLVQSFQQTEIEVDDSEVKDQHLSGNFKSVNLLDRKKANNDLTKQEKAMQGESTEVFCEIEKIRGIGPGHGMRLRKLGITTNQDLLHTVSSSKDVRSIADKLSRKPSEILSWKKMADFLRIKGVSAEFAKLLELSSINSTQDIADSNATVLAEKMSRARKKERRIHNMPDDKEINDWISHARTIEPTDD